MSENSASLSATSLRTRLRALTPARVALGRTGVSQQTSDVLAFQLAHAQARDAVHARLQVNSVSAALSEALTTSAHPNTKILHLHSAAHNRATYLQRPDLGRILDDPSRALLAASSTTGPSDLAIILADGLSALAIERHAIPLLKELLPHLESHHPAHISIVEQARVAIGDEIGFALAASVSIVLIGERPGLSSPDSLGVYITWQPRPGRTDAERNCISNIRAEGLTYSEAAAQLALYLAEAHRLQRTGTTLKPVAPLQQRVSNATKGKLE